MLPATYTTAKPKLDRTKPFDKPSKPLRVRHCWARSRAYAMGGFWG